MRGPTKLATLDVPVPVRIRTEDGEYLAGSDAAGRPDGG
jgi:hypothetical protein